MEREKAEEGKGREDGRPQSEDAASESERASERGRERRRAERERARQQAKGEEGETSAGEQPGAAGAVALVQAEPHQTHKDWHAARTPPPNSSQISRSDSTHEPDSSQESDSSRHHTCEFRHPF
eukprot:3924464-Rhodomonas_salina.1